MFPFGTKKRLNFMEQYNPLCYKIPSASLTDHKLLQHLRKTGRPLILSTGMSTMEQIKNAVELIGQDNLVLTHATSTYPCDPHELNLRMIDTLRKTFTCPIGYSGHEVGLVTSAVAVGLGACMVERHITLDRAMWGSDQAASVEPGGFEKLVKYIRVTEQSVGDGVKKVYDSELPSQKKLRRIKRLKGLLPARIKDAIGQRWAHYSSNQRWNHRNSLSSQVTGKPDEQGPVIFFNASTRIQSMSQNAAYSLLASLGTADKWSTSTLFYLQQWAGTLYPGQQSG